MIHAPGEAGDREGGEDAGDGYPFPFSGKGLVGQLFQEPGAGQQEQGNKGRIEQFGFKDEEGRAQEIDQRQEEGDPGVPGESC